MAMAWRVLHRSHLAPLDQCCVITLLHTIEDLIGGLFRCVLLCSRIPLFVEPVVMVDVNLSLARSYAQVDHHPGGDDEACPVG